MCAEDIHGPLVQANRNLLPESLIKSSLSGPLDSQSKIPMDKLALIVARRGAGTAARYRNEILETFVRFFRGVVGLNFILMDDNVRPHYFWKVRMDWPVRSPGLNSM
ncbi:hypothetical protein TNCV_3945851 [Trichonephila clavipes]|nr:hypothetical protein TNCV_3945851 [Trichonephila clavipes]